MAVVLDDEERDDGAYKAVCDLFTNSKKQDINCCAVIISELVDTNYKQTLVVIISGNGVHVMTIDSSVCVVVVVVVITSYHNNAYNTHNNCGERHPPESERQPSDLPVDERCHWTD